jgi:hypothetical protein
MPGFTASASLYKGKWNYRTATQFDSRRNAKAISQFTRAQIQQIVDVLGYGSVNCGWFEYCEGNMPHIQCGIRYQFYFLPW